MTTETGIPSEATLASSSSGDVNGVRWRAATRAGGSKANQDRYLVTPTRLGALAVVIDGATSVNNARPNGADYAEVLSQSLAAATESMASSPTNLLRHGIEHVRHELRLPGETAPSAAVALVHVSSHSVDITVLGDCTVTISISKTSQPVSLCDTRLERIAAGLRADYRQRLTEGNGFDATHAAMLARIRKIELSARNMPGGYPIAADDSAAAEHALTASYPRDTVKWITLASDGAATGPERYGTPTDWAAAVAMEPSQVLAWTHLAEEEDRQAMRWPRSKPHDDKTLIILDL
ncbi:MAG: hypothetical protein ACFCUP_11865 [Actinomycetales bacterium]